MIKKISGCFSFCIVLVVLFSFIGCEEKKSQSQSESIIKKVQAKSDLSEVFGIHLVKYEFNLKGLDIPKGKLPFVTTWVELCQGEEKIKEWGDRNNVFGDSGSILFAYYKPPLFKNDQETIEGKIIVQGNGQVKTNISLDMPFNVAAYGGGFNEKAIEMDKEYILCDIVEILSPYAKGIVHLSKDTVRDESKNKALILKVKFGLIDE